MEQPLLKGESYGKEDDCRSREHVSKTASGHVPLYPTETEEVSLEEIRSASVFSESVYPFFIHHALVSSPESDHTINQLISSQPSYNRNKQEHPLNEFGRQILDEVEVRHLLIDHVGHHLCWGGYPAKKWKIISIEDCNVYVGTLETFIEEREAIKAREPYFGGKIDGKEEGVELGIWELDLRSEFPPLFMSHKETRTKIPHSELLETCSDCGGRGEIACLMCSDQQQPGYYKPNQMSQCSTCHGRGLIAHQDGSDSICRKCSGTGKLPCATCGSRGLVKCQTCDGQGSFLTFGTALTQWRTLSTRKVAASSGAASVPDEVFHKARGVQLYNTQAYQCTPAFFADSFHLNKFSSEVIADRSSIPTSARIICERHIISVVPVTRVTMADHNRSFSFYVIGYNKEVYITNYPSKLCWGICCCLEWMKP